MAQSEDTSPSEHPTVEERRLAIEEKNLDLELRKLNVEQSKSRWMALSTIFALFTAITTVVVGAVGQHQAAKASFQTKLVEVALQDIPVSAQTMYRASVIGKLFPSYVPKDFQKNLSEVVDQGNNNGALRAGDYEGRKLLLELLNQSKNPQLTLKSFERLFSDNFAHGLDPLLTEKQ